MIFELFETFFNALEVDYIVSDISNKKILEDGQSMAHSESCINLKLFLGHIKNLEKKCNFVLIPRIKSINKGEKMCTNFYLLPDLAKNLFDIHVIYFNVDMDKNEAFKNAFVSLGLYLGFSYNKTVYAYKKAVEENKKLKEKLLLDITNKINDNNKKILIVGHTYNLYDEMIGKPITSILEKNGFTLIYADLGDDLEEDELSSSIYFSYSKSLIRSINKYKEYVSGIVLISAFPCNIDSITNELITRNIKNIPLITLLIDEADSIAMFYELREDLEKLSLANYFCEVCCRMLPDGQPADELLSLILNSLYVLKCVH